MYLYSTWLKTGERYVEMLNLVSGKLKLESLRHVFIAEMEWVVSLVNFTYNNIILYDTTTLGRVNHVLNSPVEKILERILHLYPVYTSLQYTK